MKDILSPLTEKAPSVLIISGGEPRPIASAAWGTKSDVFNPDGESTFQRLDTQEAFLKNRIPDHIALARRQQAGTARP